MSATPGAPIPRPVTGNPYDDIFYDLAENYLKGMMRLNPVVSTYLGCHSFDHMMEDLSAEGLEARASFYDDARRTFAKVDRAPLGVGAAVDLDLISADIESALFTLRELRAFENEPQLYNETIGYGFLYLTLLEPGSPLWPERLEALVSRMRALPAFLGAARANLKSPALVATRFIVEQNRGNISFVESVLPPLFDPYPALKAECDRVRPRALAALKEYQSFLETELTARSAGSWRLGRDLWTRKLALTLQSDMTPEEIERRARARLSETRERMLDLALPMHARLHPAHRHAEKGDDLINTIVTEVMEEISRRHSSPEGMLDDVRGMVGGIREFVRRRDLLALPPEADNFVIEPTPAFLDGMAVAFFNPAPAFEPHLKKSYWISTIPKDRADSYLREYNLYGLRNLTIHEAVPGHYVQFHYAQTSPIASIYKKVFASGTFAEGWAVLCEEQMYDEGYGQDDEDGGAAGLLVHRKMSLRAPINALLDARLHTGTGPEQADDAWALDLMRRLGFQEEAEAAGKLRRAKVTSTQLSTYFVGFVELGDLMADYARAKGGSFSLREFNERLLSCGTIPPRAARRLLLGGPGGSGVLSPKCR